MRMKLKNIINQENKKKIKRMRTKFGIKIKWNKIMRDKINE